MHLDKLVDGPAAIVASDRIRFKYRLEPVGREWSAETNERETNYINLKPGTYTFRVLAAGADGTWSETPGVMRVTLAPRFYHTLLFELLVAVAIVVGGLYLLYRRHDRIRRESVARERNRIVQDLHDEIDATMASIGLTLELASGGGRGGEPDGFLISQARDMTRSLSLDFRDGLWMIESGEYTLRDVCDRMRRYLISIPIPARTSFEQHG